MKEIKNIIICGLGAIGSIYAEKISKCPSKTLKVLVDKLRLEKNINNPICYNNKLLNVDYILPDNEDFKADLIIISTKFDGLQNTLENIKNFVTKDTIIISLINGITSEKIIADKYGKEKVLYSYFLGHSSIRDGQNITHDGINCIYFGTDSSLNDNKVENLKTFFDETNIKYNIPDDIIYSMWLKFMLNIASNQLTAILNFTFGELYTNKTCINLIKEINKEVQQIAKAEGVKNSELMSEQCIKNIKSMSYDGKTSMLQDVLAKRKTEVDLFAGTIIELGLKHNIPTPYNFMLKNLIDSIYENSI